MTVFVLSTILITFRSKSCKPFFKNINFERFKRCQKYIDSQIKFVRINQKRVVYVFTYDLIFIRINVIYVISDENSFSLSTLGWLWDPKIFVMRFLLTLHEMIVKVAILFWKHKWIRNDVKRTFSMNFLHS